jgi:N-acetylglucosamine kinase-like BadF-type ATPase
MSSPAAVMEAIYVGRLDARELLNLPPLVFTAASGGDRVAQQMLDEVADEVVGMATATIRRLRLASRAVEVILGGGIFRSEDGSFGDRIRDGIRRVAPSARIKRLEAPPVLGAALMGLDELHAPASARARLRRALTHVRMGRVR